MTPGEERIVRRAQVHHVQAASAGVRRHGVGEARRLVDRQIMRILEAVIQHIGREFLRPRHLPQAPQIEYLLAVRTGIVGDNVRMVPIDLDVAPDGGPGFRGQSSKENRVLRVGNVNESDAVAHAHQGVLVTALRIGPSPDIVPPGFGLPQGLTILAAPGRRRLADQSTHRVNRKPAFERDAQTRKVAGTAINAILRASAEFLGFRCRLKGIRHRPAGRRCWLVRPAVATDKNDAHTDQHGGQPSCAAPHQCEISATTLFGMKPVYQCRVPQVSLGGSENGLTRSRLIFRASGS